MSKKILVVDDQVHIREYICKFLRDQEYQVDEAVDGLDCLEKLEKSTYDILLMDKVMPKMSGMEVHKKIRQTMPDLPIILMTANSDMDTLKQIIKQGGVADFLEKPFDIGTLFNSINAIREKTDLSYKDIKKTQEDDLAEFDLKLDTLTSNSGIIGNSPKTLQMIQDIDKIAKYNTSVLITGPNGSGKELVAQRIYEQSSRVNKPFKIVNCANFAVGTAASELFGHEDGAYTGAKGIYKGIFEQADGGTIFLDEIAELPIDVQSMMLRVAEYGTFTRMKGKTMIKVDVRLITATNKNLLECIKEKTFKEDLYHRLHIGNIVVPSLAERKDDIPLLIAFFRDIYVKANYPDKRFSQEAISAMMNKEWSGNIRQLKHCVERLLIFGNKSITADDVELRYF